MIQIVDLLVRLTQILSMALVRAPLDSHPSTRVRLEKESILDNETHYGEDVSCLSTETKELLISLFCAI